MTTPDPWLQIIKQALEKATETSKGPIPGARLGVIFTRIAQESGHGFPPEAEPSLKFVGLLERYPEIVTVIRRKGSDVLVIPADQPDLLLADNAPFAIRQDLFKAFTNFRAPKDPWYEKSLDEVMWRDDGAASSDSFARIPRASEMSEIALRKAFIETVDDLEVRKELHDALSRDQPLADFSKVIRTKSRQHSWHMFRSRAIARRLIEWASAHKIPWKTDWLVPIADRSSAETRTAHLPRSWLHLVSRLDDDDVSRIMIPLDIVLKILYPAPEQ